MNFFKQLSQMMDGVDINLAIRKANGELTILLQPKATDKEVKTIIKPLNIQGSPEELDEHFFNTISTTVKKATGIIASIEVFEKDIEQTKKIVEEKANKKRESMNKKSAIPTKSCSPVVLPSEQKNSDTTVSEVVENQPTELQVEQKCLF